MKPTFKPSLWLSLTLIFVGLIGLNLFTQLLNLRFDATEDKLYTLSSGTWNIVQDIKNPVTLTFYFSKSATNVPLAYKTFGKRVVEILQEYRRINPDNLILSVIDPKPDSDEEVLAEKSGLQGANLGDGSRFFMGLVAQKGELTLAIPLFDPRRESFLEYDLSQLLVQLQGNQLQKLGVLSSLPVLGKAPTQTDHALGRPGSAPWAVFEELQKIYTLVEVSPEQPFPSDLDLLIVIHPKHFHESTLFQIDQFVLSGKPTMIFVDPYSRVDPSTQVVARLHSPVVAGSDLQVLFAHWGVEYSPLLILGDLARAAQVNTPQGSTPFALWQKLGRSALNPDMVATKGLENLLFVEPGGFRVTPSSRLKATPLLTSSTESAMVPVDMLAHSGPDVINRSIKPDGKTWDIAQVLTGEITTAFAPPPEGANTGSSRLTQSKGPAKIMLVADIDFVADQYSVERFSLLGQVVSQPKNDNLGFFINMVDFLGGSTDLMGIRSRGTFSRPFERFQDMQASAAVVYRAEQTKLNQKLKEVQGKLAQLNQQQGNQSGLSKAQLRQIELFQADELMTKKSLRKIRKLLNQDIESAKTLVILGNLLVMPLLVMIAGLGIYRRRFSPN